MAAASRNNLMKTRRSRLVNQLSSVCSLPLINWENCERLSGIYPVQSSQTFKVPHLKDKISNQVFKLVCDSEFLIDFKQIFQHCKQTAIYEAEGFFLSAVWSVHAEE